MPGQCWSKPSGAKLVERASTRTYPESVIAAPEPSPGNIEFFVPDERTLLRLVFDAVNFTGPVCRQKWPQIAIIGDSNRHTIAVDDHAGSPGLGGGTLHGAFQTCVDSIPGSDRKREDRHREAKVRR